MWPAVPMIMRAMLRTPAERLTPALSTRRLRIPAGKHYAPGETAGPCALMQTTLYSMLPPALRRWTTPGRVIVAVQFLRFGAVGVLGFVVDTATVYGTRAALGLYGAGLAGYVTAASSNWIFNRIWTFRGRGSGSAHRQWALFMLVNLVGFVLNRGTYALLVTFVPMAAEQPVIAVAAGAIAGLFTNFSLSRRVVFR
jgi:putative flippase GtrA